MPGSYADLLREAQARKQAEQKLDRIRALLESKTEGEGDDRVEYLIDQDDIRKILDGNK